MPRLILVRHGRAAAGWGDDLDPGLDDLGRRQAQDAASALAPLGPMPVVVSPLRRTRETAAPLEAQWQTEARVEPAVGEVPSPTPDLAARAAWIQEFMQSEWSRQPPELHAWRDALLAALLDLREDTVVVTHFVAINVTVGAATGTDRVATFHADYCSRNVFESDGSRLSIVSEGGQAATRVL